MIERIFVYYRTDFAKFIGKVIEFDRDTLKYSIIKEFVFTHVSAKKLSGDPLPDRLNRIAKQEKCSKVVGDYEFRVNYLFEKHHEDNLKKKKK